MLEIFLIAQSSLVLPAGTVENFEFCKKTVTLSSSPPPNQDFSSLYSSQPLSYGQLSQKSNAPIDYQYLTNSNHERWKVLAKEFDPISGTSSATLDYANSLFGSGQVVQKKGLEMQKVQWKEFDRSLEAWFKKDNNRWVLMNWKGKGF